MNKLVFTRNGICDFASPDSISQGEEIYTLFLNDSSLTVRLQKRENAPNGGYYYKKFFSYVYNVKENAHGEKYLTVYKKTDKGLCFSNDFREIGTNQFLYDKSPRGIFTTSKGNFCEEMVQAIENHLSSLLGFDFKYMHLPAKSQDHWYEGGETAFANTPEALCFPFLRDRTNRELVASLLKEDQARATVSDMSHVLKFEWDGVRGLTNVLRNSQTKEDFVRNLVYKSAVKTDEDVDFLLDNPTFLRVFSKIEMKMGATEAIKGGYAALFNNAHLFMTIPEFLGFQFLLKNLPKKATKEALKLVTRLFEFRINKQTGGVVENLTKMVNKQAKEYLSYANSWRKNLDLYFHLVPAVDKQRFSLSFLEELKVEYNKTELHYDLLMHLPKTAGDGVESCFTNVMDAFMRVYSALYLKYIPSDSLDRCASVAMELFGVDLNDDNSLSSGTVRVAKLDTTVSYYDFRTHVSKKFNSYWEGRQNLFSEIRMETETSALWNDAFFSPSNIMFGEYERMQGFMDLILASDLEKLLRKIAAKIDVGLSKLGQPVSPKNRMIYLASDAYTRKFKTNWRYYHLGVPPQEVQLYKKAGFKSKRDITFWVEAKKSLPVGMYKELLNTSAYGDTGDEISSMSL